MEFTVGMTVCTVGSFEHHGVRFEGGEVGTIVKVKEDRHNDIGVEWEIPNNNFHSLNGNCRDLHGFWMCPEQLKTYVKEFPAIDTTAIRVDGLSQVVHVQEILFANGYTWRGMGTNIRHDENVKWLCINYSHDEPKKLSYGTCNTIACDFGELRRITYQEFIDMVGSGSYARRLLAQYTWGNVIVKLFPSYNCKIKYIPELPKETFVDKIARCAELGVGHVDIEVFTGALLNSTLHKPLCPIEKTISEINKLLDKYVSRLRSKRYDLSCKSYSRGRLGENKLGRAYVKAGAGIRCYQRIIDTRLIRKNQGDIQSILESSKRPSTGLKHWGIEIECLSRLDNERLALKILPNKDVVNITYDGSLRPYEEYTNKAEIRCCVEDTPLQWEKLKSMCDELQKHCIVNRSCGLHVHYDMREERKDVVRNTALRLFKMQPLLYAVNPKYRKDGYVEKIDGRGRRNFSKYRSNYEVDTLISDGRYYGINVESLSDHNTLEVRIHAGTIDGDKIIRWVNLLRGIVNAPMKTINEFEISAQHLKKLKLSQDDIKYFMGRVELFRCVDEDPEHMPLRYIVNDEAIGF